jgi:hypothetical protein
MRHRPPLKDRHSATALPIALSLDLWRSMAGNGHRPPHRQSPPAAGQSAPGGAVDGSAASFARRSDAVRALLTVGERILNPLCAHRNLAEAHTFGSGLAAPYHPGTARRRSFAAPALLPAHAPPAARPHTGAQR